MLAIARALARDIKVLLLDEPYEGLAPVIVQEIEKTLNIIKEQDITTVIVEQNAVAALNLADRALILIPAMWSSMARRAKCSTIPSCGTNIWRSDPLPGGHFAGSIQDQSSRSSVP